MWTSVRNVKQVLDHSVRKGALSTVCMCMCMCCCLMPKDDILRYVGRNSVLRARRGKNSRGSFVSSLEQETSL